MSKIWVNGEDGQLGSEMAVLAKGNDAFVFTALKDLDLCDHAAVRQFITHHEITTIVNCAAYTAVDKAEEDAELANAVNHLAVKNIAQIAKEKSIKLIHISTDYVFDGKGHQPYKTDYPIAPISVYGQTKADGELAIKQSGANAVIIRTAWVYSTFGNNFVKTMLRLGSERSELNVVEDQIGSPTYAADLAGLIYEYIIDYQPQGTEIYHYTNEGVCSWYDFASAIMEIKQLKCKVKAIPGEKYPTPAKRPSYSVLDKNSLKEKFELEIPHWRTSLINCLAHL